MLGASIVLLGLAAVTSTASAEALLAPASPAPSTGKNLIIGGSVLAAVGGLNMSTAPLCRTGSLLPNETWEDVCFVGSLVLGGVYVVVGLTLVATGVVDRARYLEWRASQTGLTLAPARLKGGGRGLSLRLEF